MTKPIFRLVENTFYLGNDFENSEDYIETKNLLKNRAEEKGYTEENHTFIYQFSSDEIYYTTTLEIYEA